MSITFQRPWLGSSVGRSRELTMSYFQCLIGFSTSLQPNVTVNPGSVCHGSHKALATRMEKATHRSYSPSWEVAQSWWATFSLHKARFVAHHELFSWLPERPEPISVFSCSDFFISIPSLFTFLLFLMELLIFLCYLPFNSSGCILSLCSSISYLSVNLHISTSVSFLQ